MATQEDKRAAWDFALGMIQVDGLEPSPEFKEMIEKEIRGEITEAELLDYIKKTTEQSRKENNYGIEST